MFSKLSIQRDDFNMFKECFFQKIETKKSGFLGPLPKNEKKNLDRKIFCL